MSPCDAEGVARGVERGSWSSKSMRLIPDMVREVRMIGENGLSDVMEVKKASEYDGDEMF